MPSAAHSTELRRHAVRAFSLIFILLCALGPGWAAASMPLRFLDTSSAVRNAATVVVPPDSVEDPSLIIWQLPAYWSAARSDPWPRSGEAWLAVPVEATAGSEWVAHVHNMLLQTVDLWIYHAGQLQSHVRSGMSDIIQRPPGLDISYRLPFTLKQDGGYTLLMRVRGPVLEYPVIEFVAAAKEEVSEAMRRAAIILSFGVLLGFVLYNLAQWIVSRDTTYLWFSIYAGGAVVVYASGYGLLAEFLHLPDPVLYVNRSALILYFVLALFFAYRLLDIGSRHNDLRPYFVSFGMAFAVLEAMLPIIPVADGLPFLRSLGLLEAIFLFGVGIHAARQGYRPARYFSVGWAVMLLGVMNLAFAMMAWTDFSYHDTDWMLYATVTQLMIFSLALGERMRTTVVERSAMEAAARAQSAFISNMSHEIRTPLTAIIGGADLLQRAALPIQAERNVKAIRSAGTALLDVLNKILDFSKLESGPLALRPEPFKVQELIDEVCTMVTPKAEAKRIHTFCHLDARVPPLVRADRHYLRQVLLNLADNGVKFTQQGQVDIRVVVDHAEGERAQLRFMVRDTGPGIDPHDQARLFRRFSQVDATGRRFGGTGLGLAICRRVVESMGGAIGVTSRVGEGSTFWFSIPVDVADGAAQVEQAVRGLAPVVVSDLKVLVVDDVDLNRHIIGEMLQPEHQHIDYAIDGADALDLWLNNHYDLILLDVHMPGLDGLEFVAQVRRYTEPARRDVPIIGVTASVETEQCRTYLAAGMDAVLTKPFTKDQLVESIAGLLRSSIEARDTERALDAERRRRFLGKFVEIGAGYVDELHEAVRRGRPEDVVFQAHRLAGAAAMVGLDPLADAARELEREAKSAAPGHCYSDCLQRLEGHWVTVRDQVLGTAA